MNPDPIPTQIYTIPTPNPIPLHMNPNPESNPDSDSDSSFDSDSGFAPGLVAAQLVSTILEYHNSSQWSVHSSALVWKNLVSHIMVKIKFDQFLDLLGFVLSSGVEISPNYHLSAG